MPKTVIDAYCEISLIAINLRYFPIKKASILEACELAIV